MEPWFDQAKNFTEIAIVYPKTINEIRYSKAVSGAVRMLCELKQQFDIVTEFSDWNKYQVLVIPDDVTFSAETACRVKAHIAVGKTVISSGISGINPVKTQFVLEQEWGIKFKQECDFDPAYFAVGKNFNQGLPDMPLSLYSSGIESETLPDTSTEAYLIKPYYNRHWDGEHAFYYNPPDKVTDIPVLTVCGKVAHFSHRIFSGYNLQAPVELRRLFANVLEYFLPEPLIKTGNLPSFARAFVTEQPGRKIVHILAYVPELRGETTQMIEEPVTILDVKIALRLDGKTPEQVYLAPSQQALAFDIHDGYVSAVIPVINGYSMLIFEE